jgi:CBS domain containing-hemolysin-like protein
VIGIVIEDGPNLPDGKVQTLLKVDKSLRAPDLLRQFLASNHFANAVDQNGQDAGRLRL